MQEENKGLKQQDKKKKERPKYSDRGSNPCKEKDKKKKEKTKCTYCHKVWNTESARMKKTIDIMVQLLEKNNIPLPEGIRNKDGGLG